MEVKINSKVFNGILIGIFLTIFFISGFIFRGQFTNSTEPTQLNDSKSDSQKVKSLSKERVISKAKNYLSRKLPPFVVNISTASLEKNKNIEGVDYMYNWKVEFTVEPNNYGQWATNETTKKPYNFYLSKNGNYIFYSPPESTEVEERSRGPIYSR